MIRAIIISPEFMLPLARDILISALGEGGKFGAQKWADATGQNYGVAAGLFDKGLPERLTSAAAEVSVAFAIPDQESLYMADPARIMFLASNKPLEAIQRMGLTPVETRVTDP